MNPETITAAITALISLIEFVTKAQADIQQSAEWSKEERDAMDAKIKSIPALPHWQPND